MSNPTLQERRDALAQEIARIQEKNKGQRPPAANRTSPDFLEKYTGIFANDPLFEEMIRSIEEERERGRREARAEGDFEDTPA